MSKFIVVEGLDGTGKTTQIKILADYIKSKLGNYSGKIYTIDARKISIDALGKYFPNTPMLAAIVKISGVMTDEELLEDMK